MHVRALVTGASGFLGRHLVTKLLEEQIAVRALVRRPDSGMPPDVEQVLGDLCDEACLRRATGGVDWVVHAGARVSTKGTWAEFEAVNVSATASVLRAAQAAGASRIVHVSSLSVYAVPANGAVVSEDSSYEEGAAERGLYSRSKLIADRLALQAAHGGAPVVVIRPGLLYGPGRRPPLARRAFAIGRLRVILGSPSYLLPLSYVENVADALLLAGRAEGVCGRAYTIVDTNVGQAEYGVLYRQAARQQWRAVYVPAALLLPLAYGVEIAARSLRRAPPLTRHQLRRTTWSARYDVTRAERELGWRPRVDVREGLRRCFDSLK